MAPAAAAAVKTIAKDDSPVLQLLGGQAEALRKRTNGAVGAEIRQSKLDSELIDYGFQLCVPSRPRYRYELFSVRVEPRTGRISVETSEFGEWLVVDDLSSWLNTKLHSAETEDKVRRLMKTA